MKYIISILLLSFFAGCSDEQATLSRVSALEARATKAEDQVRLQAATLSRLQVDLWSKLESESPAIIDPASKGYSIARNEYGAFPVIIEDAQPYLDGHKVKFRIGNLASAAMTDVTLALVYGVRDPAFPARDPKLSDDENAKIFRQYIATTEENKNSRKALSVETGKELPPASWTIVEAIIAQSKPEDLGRIEVYVKIAGMKLATAK